MRLIENEVQSKYQKCLTVNTCACSINYVQCGIVVKGRLECCSISSKFILGLIV